MPGFYRRPEPDAAISQGDIFIDVPVIGVSLDPLYRVVVENDAPRLEPVEPDGLTGETLLVEQVALTKAIVISQSCDAERAPRLMLAPLADFRLEEKKPDKQWQRISRAATSLNEPKDIYLPGNPTLALPRSSADFGEAFTLPRLFLKELARRGKRVAGLGEKAIAYLQFRLGVMLTRVAQDDYAWPSGEDIDIKVAYLEGHIQDLERRDERCGRELDAAREKGESVGKIEELSAEREEFRERLAYLRQQLKEAKAARPTADDLEE